MDGFECCFDEFYHYRLEGHTLNRENHATVGDVLPEIKVSSQSDKQELQSPQNYYNENIDYSMKSFNEKFYVPNIEESMAFWKLNDNLKSDESNSAYTQSQDPLNTFSYQQMQQNFEGLTKFDMITVQTQHQFVQLPSNKTASQRVLTYRKGKETARMKQQCPDYNRSYEECEVFKIIGKKGGNKAIFAALGENYNVFFYDAIKSQKLPKFGRNEKRNLSVAVWFFERIKDKIYPWILNQ